MRGGRADPALRPGPDEALGRFQEGAAFDDHAEAVALGHRLRAAERGQELPATDGHIVVFKLSTCATVPLEGGCRKPSALELDAAVHLIYVGYRGDEKAAPRLQVVDAAGGREITSVPIGSGDDEDSLHFVPDTFNVLTYAR